MQELTTLRLRINELELALLSAREEMEFALLNSETRYKKLVANVPGMIYQFRQEPDGTASFPYVSSGCREIYGVEPEAELKPANIHEGIDSTLMLLEHRLKAKPNRPEITVIKEYGNLPLIECYAGQLNKRVYEYFGKCYRCFGRVISQ